MMLGFEGDVYVLFVLVNAQHFILLLDFLSYFFQEALAPRSARNIKSYAEADPSERGNKRKKKEFEPPERVQKRRKAEYSAPAVPMVDGASVQVRSWSYGNLSKRDALRFSRAVRFYYFLQF